jgi:hypothetical protein
VPAGRVLALAALTFLSFEAPARVALSSKRFLDSVQETDTVLRNMWLNDHHRGGELYQTFERFDDQLGWRPKSGLRNFPAFGGKFVSTNSQGFRGSTEFPLQNPEGRPRIVLLGDSFTFGDDGNDDEIWAHFLGRLLPEAEILNLGVSGYGIDQMLLYFDLAGARYRPVVVVVGVFPDDIRRARFSFFSNAKPRFVRDSGELRLEGVPVPSPDTIRASYRWRPKILDLLAIGWETWQVRGRIGIDEDRERASTLFRLLASSARRAGAKPVFVHFPANLTELNSASSETSPAEVDLMRFASESGAIFTSSRESFRQRVQLGESFGAAAGGHWLPAGHAVVAEHVARLLRREHLLDKTRDRPARAGG